MKILIRKTLIIALVAVTFTSCMIDGFNTVNGNRNVITENRNIKEPFEQVEVGQGIDLYITQDTKQSLVVSADENLHKLIKTEITNGVLKIYSKRNIRRAKSKKIYLSMPVINSIKASSGADVYTENTINATTFNATVSSGADARIEVIASTISASASSGADMILRGKTTNLSVKASSGSSINAYNLKSKEASAKVSSGANIDVYVTESLTARASSGGDIDYKGDPKSTDKKRSSGGSISAH
ncbi:MAG: DUF2807 domain-containing protein [Flavobacteriaceae bacterium]|nr:DUF2807 domain-containing protein [Flavobacteriaceae bacterium]